MAFLIYKKYGNAETIRYEKIKPLKLGGRDGLIAQHVKTLTEDEAAELENRCARVAEACRFRRRGGRTGGAV